jgi:hypothetical protein
VPNPWQTLDAGKGAANIGEIDADLSQVVLQAELGGEHILEELEDGRLTCIC